MTKALKYGDKAIVEGQRVHVGSVLGYTASYDINGVVAAIERAKQNGHELFWLSLAPTVICGDKGYYERDRAEWAAAPVLSLGDVVTIDDSPTFVIERTHNRNFALRPVIVKSIKEVLSIFPTDTPAGAAGRARKEAK